VCLGCQDGAEVVEEASHHARWRPNWCAGRVLWAAAIHTLSDHPIHSKRVSGKRTMGQKEPIRAFCLQGFRTTIAPTQCLLPICRMWIYRGSLGMHSLGSDIHVVGWIAPC